MTLPGRVRRGDPITAAQLNTYRGGIARARVASSPSTSRIDSAAGTAITAQPKRTAVLRAWVVSSDPDTPTTDLITYTVRVFDPAQREGDTIEVTAFNTLANAGALEIQPAPPGSPVELWQYPLSATTYQTRAIVYGERVVVADCEGAAQDPMEARIAQLEAALGTLLAARQTIPEADE